MRDVLNFQNLGLDDSKFSTNYIQTLLKDLQKHDSGTHAHCVRVAKMAMNLADHLGLNKNDQMLCKYSGLLHDIGKMQIPNEVLNKPSKLTDQEYEWVKKHAQFGAELLEPLIDLPFFKKVSEVILYHHERVDGLGYYGLAENKIPFVSKVILVVDTVDAMTEDRAYRKGLSMEAVCEELVRCSGTQFDAAIVNCYLNSLEASKPAKVSHRKSA